MPSRYFALLACLTIMVMAGCGTNERENDLSQIKKLESAEIANVEFAYMIKERFQIDAPPLRRKVSTSNYSSLCEALQKARAESEKEQVGLATTNPLTLEIQVKESGEEKKIIYFVYGDLFELRAPSDKGETVIVRFHCRDLMDWAARYQADMDIKFLASIDELQPDFDLEVVFFDRLILRLKIALPFYDFSGFDNSKDALAAKNFAEWYKNNKDKLVWSATDGHYMLTD